jgi:hypothetical protein
LKGIWVLYTLEELGLTSLHGWDDSISAWLFVGLTDFACPECEIFYGMITPRSEGVFPGDYRFLCLSCLTHKRFIDFPMGYQSALSDKFKMISEDGVEKYAKESVNSLQTMKLILDGKTEGSISVVNREHSSNGSFAVLKRELKGNEDAPIPRGYRSISWIRFYEAEAIIHCYKSKADFELKSDSMDVVLKCSYFPDDSEERQKFKANVQAIRINNQNQRVIGWIRQEEARAVVEANRLGQDIDFSHLKFGNGGKVQFFPENLDVAKKYRSTTRLLRKD